MININKPKSDNREFRGGILKNKIKYILINDKFLTKSYISVSINAGSYNNPKNYDGIAHFLEHMLFMGSKKYPKENYFMNKLQEYGGSSNAYTESLTTTYFFNVFDNGLSEIIDIFSRFFIDPLFNSESVMREINAVDNEHKKNINNDYRNFYQLLLFLSNEDSVINTFATGSLNTLNKPDIREKMIDFYHKYYTSDNMSICIASSKSFDDLISLIENTFSTIPLKIKHPFSISRPFYNLNKNKAFFLKSIRDIYNISYIWELPSLNNFINSKDFTIFEFLLTNKSNKSLYYILTKMGYLDYISSDISDEGIFILKLELSKEGYKNITYINNLVYLYIDNIYKLNINDYAKYYQKIMNINFNYNNKSDTEDLCNLLCTNHFKYNTKDVFSADFLIIDIKKSEDYIALYKQHLINLNSLNAIIICSSKKFKDNDNDDDDDDDDDNYIKIREYNSVYKLINNNIFDLKKISNIPELHGFDLNNNYLDIQIKNSSNSKKFEKPYLISDKLWFGHYSKYNEPIINILLQLNNNIYFNSPINYILTTLSSHIINYLLKIILYKPLDVCYNIYFSSSNVYSSINIYISGPNDITKIQLLINDLINFILNIEKYFDDLSELYLKNLLITFKKSLKNFKYKTPWDYNDVLVNDIYSTNYNIKLLLIKLKEINYNNIKNHMINLLNNTNITSFIYGNINKYDINNFFLKIKKNFTLPYLKYPEISLLSNNIVKHSYKKETNNFVGLYFFVGFFEPEKYLLMKLLVNILSELFFNKLRTKKQLGYLVSMSYILFRDEYYISQKIQSAKPITFIIKNINKFNKKILLYLQKINFNKFIESLKNQINEPENSLNDQYSIYCSEILNRKYIFNKKEILLENIEKITPRKLKMFSIKYLNEKNKIYRIIQGNN
jgi:insulysin